jgi:hypothetical protein
MKLLKFSQYISENRDIQGAESQAAELGKTAAKINRLIDLGLVDDAGYRKEFKKIVDSYQQLVKGLKLNYKEQEDLDLLKRIGQLAGINTFAGLETSGAKALFAKGLHMVSSPTQLVNGSIVFSLDPNYRSSDGWGIGFFPGPRVIRRMTPKGIDVGIWGRRTGSMDIRIKDFSDTTSSVLDFYDKAMQWAADHIDFEKAALYPEPTEWKYYVKKKGQAQATRTEADDLDVQAQALISSSKTHPYFDAATRIKAYETMREAYLLKVKAAEMRGDGDAKQTYLRYIDNISNQIKHLKSK